MADSRDPDFNLTNGRGYMLEGNYAAANRLDLQTLPWKTTFGFNIHPAIRIKQDARIADIATGTDLWVIEVARELPAASVLCLNIDLAKAPHESWMPANVSLRVWNILEEIPDDLLGNFDFIHVRLAVLVIRNSDPQPLLQRIMKLLKPGGYLQWDELNYAGITVETTNTLAKIHALDRFRDMIVSRVRSDWTVKLAEFAKHEGFEDTNIDHFDGKKETTGPHKTTSYFMTIDEFASRLEEDGTKMKEIIQDARQEIYEGGAIFMPKIICVARKPEDGKSRDPAAAWYREEIGPRLKPAMQEVYHKWVGLSGDALNARLHEIRERACAYAPYPCIGQWMFLMPSITAFPQYSSLVTRAKQGAAILDLACCLGQDLRFLASAGVPTDNMYASDLVAELWELGFQLFNDRDVMKAQFIQADIFDTHSRLNELDGKIDIIIACQFLHLFDWDGQIKAIRKIIELSRLESVVVGYQRARMSPMKVPFPWGEMFIHDPTTFREIWGKAAEGTGTKWKVESVLVDLGEWGCEEEDTAWMEQYPMGLNFVISRLE